VGAAVTGMGVGVGLAVGALTNLILGVPERS